MNLPANFELAVQEFRTFLVDRGEPRTIAWLEPADLLISSRRSSVILATSENGRGGVEAALRFRRGREATGHVALEAIYDLGEEIGCIVTTPPSEALASDMFIQGLTLKLRSPLQHARRIPRFLLMFAKVCTIGRPLPKDLVSELFGFACGQSCPPSCKGHPLDIFAGA